MGLGHYYFARISVSVTPYLLFSKRLSQLRFDNQVLTMSFNYDSLTYYNILTVESVWLFYLPNYKMPTGSKDEHVNADHQQRSDAVSTVRQGQDEDGSEREQHLRSHGGR